MVCVVFYFEIGHALPCPFPVVFIVHVLITSPFPIGFHMCLIVVLTCVYLSPCLSPSLSYVVGQFCLCFRSVYNVGLVD